MAELNTRLDRPIPGLIIDRVRLCAFSINPGRVPSTPLVIFLFVGFFLFTFTFYAPKGGFFIGGDNKGVINPKKYIKNTTKKSKQYNLSPNPNRETKK